MFTFFSLIIFLGILFIFGWQLARFILNEKRIEALIPLAVVLGCSVYLFSLNFLSYFINIEINFYLLCLIFIFLSYFLFKANRKKEKTEWGINKKWRRILFATCFLIMVLVGIMGIRSIGDAEPALTHLPLAATIAEGNFPVQEIFAPHFPTQHHYGNNLFLAAFSKITNLSLWSGRDLQNFIFIGILFLLGFLLIKDFCKDNFKAYLASLVMILGGNLNFLYGIEGLSSLYQKYILHLSVEAPFKFLSDMIFGEKVIGKVIIYYYSQDPWVILGFALTITVIYLFFRAINDEKNWFKISLLASIVFSFLALTAELFFGALCIVFLIYPLFFTILKKDWSRGKFYLKNSFLILFLGALIASLQGGIATQTVKQILFSYSFPINYHFLLTPEYLLKGLMFFGGGHFVSIFSSTFFLVWGWLVIFIVPVAFYLLKKYFQLGLFLILLIFISFFLPLVFISVALQEDFMRINLLTSLFWNLIFGLFLGWLFLSPTFFKKVGDKWQKLLMIILILGVTFQGLLYFALLPIFPNLQRGRPLFEELPKLNPVELEAINWIKKHTTIKDYFLTFGEESSNFHHNSKFIIYAGRFAPNFHYGADIQRLQNYYQDLATPIPEIVWYQKVLKECEPYALKTLSYRYLYINENWPQGLEEKCLAKNDLELKFTYSQDQHFARIYLLR